MEDEKLNRNDSKADCSANANPEVSPSGAVKDTENTGNDLSIGRPSYQDVGNLLGNFEYSNNDDLKLFPTMDSDNLTKEGSSNIKGKASGQEKISRSASVDVGVNSSRKLSFSSNLSLSQEFTKSVGCMRPRYHRLGSRIESNAAKTSNDNNESGKTGDGVPSYGSFHAQGQGCDLESSSQKRGNPLDEEEEFSFRRSSTRLKFTLLSIALVNFCSYAAFAILAPFFPQEALDKGVDQSVVGFIFGVCHLIIIVSAPFLGSMITKIGAKFMFISGIFVSGVCSALFGTLDMMPSGTVYIVMCFITRSLEALGSSALVVASFAIIAHEFPRNVATVFGALETFTGFGLMVGPPIGGALYQLGGFGLPFFTLGGTLTACGLACIWLMPAQNYHDSPQEGSTLSLFLKPSAFVITMSIVVGSLAVGFLAPTLAVHLAKFDLSPFWVGAMFFLAPAVYALTAPIWGWIGDNKGYIVTMIVGGNILCAVAFLLLGPVPFFGVTLELWIVIVALIVLGLFLGCAMIPTFKALIDSASVNGYPESFQTFGIISGLFHSAFSFGAFLGPTTLGGVVIDSIGFPWTAAITALFFVIIGLVVLARYFIAKYLVNGQQRTESLRLNPYKSSDKDDNDHEKAAILYSPVAPPDIIRSNSCYCPGDLTTNKSNFHK